MRRDETSRPAFLASLFLGRPSMTADGADTAPLQLRVMGRDVALRRPKSARLSDPFGGSRGNEAHFCLETSN
jgi:hypothetical protein